MAKYSLDKDKIRIVLFEGLHPSSLKTLADAGYHNVESLSTALPEDELIEKIKDAHFIGIRSRTQLTERVINAADKLVAIGCFCIGTNQVDLHAAKERGIPVFNAPFSNTRSVAELVLGEILLLLRGIPEKNAQAHRGIWTKSANNSFEARGKVLGIIGYGHIGTQLGILAETVGLHVIYYDVESQLSLGNAVQVNSMDELLQQADIVSLHVPETPQTRYMFGAEQLAQMKEGSYLINAARGTVVDIEALTEALRSKKLAGAAIDVYPTEPSSNKEEFVSPLREFDNVLLTPHIGGSTQEAQENIGIEVAGKLIKYSDNGSTLSAVNFPEVSLPANTKRSRLLHVHHNKPGVLTEINQMFARNGINIAAQFLQTEAEIGYVVIDIDHDDAEEALNELKTIKGTIRCRVLH